MLYQNSSKGKEESALLRQGISSEKFSENINQSDIILWCPENNCRAYL